MRAAETSIATHEGVCAERYTGITDKLSGLRSDIRNLVMAVIAMAAVAGITSPLAPVISRLVGH